MTAFVDTNVLIRYLTGDPPAMARRASAYLSQRDGLLLTDVVVAETVYVLESFYRLSRPDIADLLRAMVTFPNIVVDDRAMLLRAIEVYEVYGIDFAEAYLVARAEESEVGAVASFDRAIDRVETVRRIEP